MNYAESIELTSWKKNDLLSALNPNRIRIVRSLCVAIFFTLEISFVAIFFYLGITLQEKGIIPELTIFQEYLSLLILCVFCIFIYFLTTYSTILISSKMRIMPRRFARHCIENWNSNGSEIAIITGINVGDGGC